MLQMVGRIKISKQGTITFKIMETSLSNQISWQMDVDKGRLKKLGYDMIIGKYLPWALKITINLKYQVIKWKDTSIPTQQVLFDNVKN